MTANTKATICVIESKRVEAAMTTAQPPMEPAAAIAAGWPAPKRGAVLYLAGPMTGLPDLNHPQFHSAAAQLRRLGWHVQNPAESTNPVRYTWEGWMRLALAKLVRCDTIALLPGWEESRGACLELDVARALEMQVLILPEGPGE